MNKGKKRRRDWLLSLRRPGLLKIEDAALILRISVATARQYKQLSIIDPRHKMGQADLFDLDEIRWTRKRRETLKMTNNLRQMAKILEREREEYRDQNPRSFDPPEEFVVR